jgi:hypothetical protein
VPVVPPVVRGSWAVPVVPLAGDASGAPVPVMLRPPVEAGSRKIVGFGGMAPVAA